MNPILTPPMDPPHSLPPFCAPQQLTPLLQQCPPPPPLRNLITMISTFRPHNTHSTGAFVNFIDELCDEVLRLSGDSVVVASLAREDDIDAIVRNFVTHPHHQEWKVQPANQMHIRRYRTTISQFFHSLLHHNTLKVLPKLCILFYKLISIQMLTTQVTNYFYLILTLSHENIAANRDTRIIKACLRSLYEKGIIFVGVDQERNTNKKKKGASKLPSNYHLYEREHEDAASFVVIAYLIYFGNITAHKTSQKDRATDTQMIGKFLEHPNQISSLILSFRNQFPSHLILKCHRNMNSLSQCIIDNYVLRSLLRIYLDYKLQPKLKQNLHLIIKTQVQYNLTVHTVKNMIKILEIGDMEDSEEKWKKMFRILKTALPENSKIISKEEGKGQLKVESPTRTRQQLSWEKLEKAFSSPAATARVKKQSDILKLTRKSHFTINFQSQFNGFEVKFRSYRTNGQFMLFKLKNQQNEIWTIARHLGLRQFQVEVMRMSKDAVDVNKIELDWDPLDKHQIVCKVKGNQIEFEFVENCATEVSEMSEDGKSPHQVRIKNIKPKTMHIGTDENSIPCYFTEIFSLVIASQGRTGQDYVRSNKNKIRQSSKHVKISTRLELIDILKKLGDLDLFFLICSHLLRKVEGDDSLKVMLKEVNNFLEFLVVAKGVQGVKLTQEMKQHRFYNVRFLVWLASKYKRDPDAIFQILRLLEIRGIKKPLQCLQILSNIGLWKEMPQKFHARILQRIKQTSSQIPQEHAPQLLTMFRRIMLDYMIFYKNNQLLNENLQNQYLLKQSQIMGLVYEVVVGQSVAAVFGFIEFLLKIMYILLDRTKNSDYIDSSIGFQVSLLAYRLLITVRQAQFHNSSQKVKMPINKSSKMTKTGLTSQRSLNVPSSGYFKKDEQTLVVKIEETLVWANEIVYCLSNQLQHADERIKFYDWSWAGHKERINSSVFSVNKKGLFPGHREAKEVSEMQVLQLCECIQAGLLGYNKSVFNLLSSYDLIYSKPTIFWKVNLFQRHLSNQKFIDGLKFGHFDTIIWDDEKIMQVLQRSFDLTQNGIALKLPDKLLTSMKAKDVNLIHNSLLGVYYDKCQQVNPLQKQRCAQKIMCIIAVLPDSLYSNTHFLREQLRKDKRNLKMVELVEKHLIIKELTKEGFKLLKQMKMNETRDLASTIVAFGDNDNVGQKSENSDKILNISAQTQEVQSKKSKDRKNSQQLVVFSNLENVDFQESFWQVPENQGSQAITNEKIKQSLQHLKLLANPGSIQAFYKIPNIAQSRKQTKQQIQGYIMNFNINIDAIMQLLEQSGNQSKVDKLSQLQSYIFFIEKHLYSFSKMIISEFLFTEIKELKVDEEPIKAKRKKSFQSSNFKFKQVIETMLQQFLRERRKGIYKTENVWFNVQRNNKDLWEIFFKSEKKNQSVDVVCNALKLKGLIKIDHQKRQIELPKNMTTISNKFSISGDSHEDQHQSQISESAIFQDVNLYQQQQQQQDEKQEAPKLMSLKEKVMNDMTKKRHKKDNEFPVTYITTTTTYQGVIFCEPGTIKFVQNLIPNQNLYDVICANQNQQRTALQIEKRRQTFEINLNQKSTIILKKYLYHDAAVQIFSQRKTSFFVFVKGSQREQFFKHYSHVKGTIPNEAQLIQAANRQMQRWINGDISNFTYLMHINDLSGRTFNDMSQYYIFPWVLTNYKSQKFNKKFIHNQSNYRDLSKPVGALNPKRFEQLQTRFKQSTKYQQTQSYLYGSFCSNPAIVCNYLVRLQPFSMHHYLLQSKQFDLADRIFYSVANQFAGCYTNMGDYKELIPQFYSCPEFLRNRNKYKFGEKQNKEIVNNVQLPEWALYQFNSRKTKCLESKAQSFLPQQQFIFRMRKCLESDYVTKNINMWIDLIFGVYNQKDRAMEKNNLYISNIYINQLKKKQKKNKQMLLIFFKQFGQMPRLLFEGEHKLYKGSRVYYKLRDSQVHTITEMQNKSISDKNFYADSRFFVDWNNNSINFIDIKNKTGLITTTENSLTQIQLKNQQIDQLKILSVEAESQETKKLDLLLYLKLGKLYVREMSISTFRKKLEVKDEKQNFYSVDTQFRLMEIFEQQKIIVFVTVSSIKVYQYSLQANSIQKSGQMSFGGSRLQFFNSTDQILKILISKKYELRLSLKFEFTQHKSRIEHISICQSYGLLISLDSNRKVYILKISSKQIQVIQYFRLKKLTNCQQIVQMQVHDMGYILILTTLSTIHVYNLMGDYVGFFNASTLCEINRRMCRKVESSVDAELKVAGKEETNVNARKKSGNDMAVGDRIISCEIEESDHDNPSIIINEEQLMHEGHQKYKSSIPFEKQPKNDQFNKNNGTQESNQEIISMKIWNQESLQLIIGTNLGCVYRFDFFMVEDCEKIDFTKSVTLKQKQKDNKNKQKHNKNISIEYMSVNRIGRHWQCWVASSNQLFKIESQDFRNADKRNEEYKKKSVLE